MDRIAMPAVQPNPYFEFYKEHLLQPGRTPISQVYTPGNSLFIANNEDLLNELKASNKKFKGLKISFVIGMPFYKTQSTLNKAMYHKEAHLLIQLDRDEYKLYMAIRPSAIWVEHRTDVFVYDKMDKDKKTIGQYLADIIRTIR